MARLSDHDVRDAEDALRAEIGLVVKRYIRRMTEMGKAYIQEDVEEAIKEGRAVDGTTLGRAAAARAASTYFNGLAGSGPYPVIESAPDLADGYA